MSVDSYKGRVTYTGDGKTTSFSFPFAIREPGQAAVYVADGSGRDKLEAARIALREGGGGTATLAKAPAKGAGVAIVLNMPFSQGDHYNTGSRFDPQVLEERLDLDCLERQQLLEGLSRAVKMPATSLQTPEEYQEKWFEEAAAARDAAISAVNARAKAAEASVRGEAAKAAQASEQAQNSAESADKTAAEIKSALAGEFANGVKQALNAASAAKNAAADVEGAVIQAAEYAAACIINKLSSWVVQTQASAGAAAAAACAATANSEKTWRMAREMTGEAGRQAAACILAQTCHDAKISGANAASAAASASAAAGLALDMAAIIKGKAKEAAEEAAAEASGCITNICEYSAEICIAQARACASSAAAASAAAVDADMKLRAAAKQATEDLCACYLETLNECVGMALAHARASAASAKASCGYALQAKQADVCEEAEIRRLKDEELEKLIRENSGERLDALARQIGELERRIGAIESKYVWIAPDRD